MNAADSSPRPSDEAVKAAVADYIRTTRLAVLTTVREDGAPVSRVMGSFAPQGVDVYFSTRKDAAKTRHIARNNLVNFYFQHDNQEMASFSCVTIIGRAEVAEGPVFDHGLALLSARSPRFKARVENGELANIGIYLIRAKEIKYLDCARPFGPEATCELIV